MLRRRQALSFMVDGGFQLVICELSQQVKRSSSAAGAAARLRAQAAACPVDLAELAKSRLLEWQLLNKLLLLRRTQSLARLEAELCNLRAARP
jgi:hypothetical protein